MLITGEQKVKGLPHGKISDLSKFIALSGTCDILF